jgi:Ca-activated chloride channel family protein
MTRRVLIPLLVLFAWLPLPAFQGATITGSVVDGNLNLVVGARLTLEQGPRVIARTTSGTDGRYTFAAVAAGDYTIRAAGPTGPATTRTVTVAQGSPRLTLPIVLQTTPLESPARANEIAVSGGASVVGVRPTPPPLMPPPAPQTTRAVAGGGAGRGGGVYHESLRPEGDRYARVEPGRFQSAHEHPLSTFGADVDTASYANVRRFLSEGQLPPRDAVRIEEMLNYFHPEYASPRGRDPLSITTEVGPAPWNPAHRLVLIGVKARSAARTGIEGRNIVLLVDVSGSMASDDRLPLIKTALGLFVDSLQPDDRLAIVTYAGTSGVHLRSTPIRQRSTIQRAIASLNASGSTNGAQGIITAYRVAREEFIPGGINRVMLATDGDFNVGVTSQDSLTRLIERERDSGVFLSIFGVGRGNLNDAGLEAIANKGNGHYVYLDSLQEARRVMLRETDAMLETVARDVKFQVEFNPRVVQEWKLLGYENRVMADRDFDDDRKDGGELGAGHTVTMLYEVVPVSSRESSTTEWLTVNARFKAPDADESSLLTHVARGASTVRHLPFAASIAEFGMLLRAGDRTRGQWEDLHDRALAAHVPASLVADKANFVELVETAQGLSRLRR